MCCYYFYDVIMIMTLLCLCGYYVDYQKVFFVYDDSYVFDLLALMKCDVVHGHHFYDMIS